MYLLQCYNVIYNMSDFDHKHKALLFEHEDFLVGVLTHP